MVQLTYKFYHVIQLIHGLKKTIKWPTKVLKKSMVLNKDPEKNFFTVSKMLKRIVKKRSEKFDNAESRNIEEFHLLC